MTNQQHPITPPSALVKQWLSSHDFLWGPLEQRSITITPNRLQHVATRAAQWGADQELEACEEWWALQLNYTDQKYIVPYLRDYRRPKPPSLKKQAFAALEQIEVDFNTGGFGETIRKAIEAMPND